MDFKPHITCSICLDIYEVPRTLPCLHTFCFNCLESLLGNNSVKCPECNKVHAIDHNGLEGLPISPQVVLLMDMFRKAQPPMDVDVEIKSVEEGYQKVHKIVEDFEKQKDECRKTFEDLSNIDDIKKFGVELKDLVDEFERLSSETDNESSARKKEIYEAGLKILDNTKVKEIQKNKSNALQLVLKFNHLLAEFSSTRQQALDVGNEFYGKLDFHQRFKKWQVVKLPKLLNVNIFKFAIASSVSHTSGNMYVVDRKKDNIFGLGPIPREIPEEFTLEHETSILCPSPRAVAVDGNVLYVACEKQLRRYGGLDKYLAFKTAYEEQDSRSFNDLFLYTEKYEINEYHKVQKERKILLFSYLMSEKDESDTEKKLENYCVNRILVDDIKESNYYTSNSRIENIQMSENNASIVFTHQLCLARGNCLMFGSQKFDTGGKPIRGIATDAKQRIYALLDEPACVRVFDREGCYFTDIPLPNPGQALKDIQVMKDGRIVVACEDQFLVL